MMKPHTYVPRYPRTGTPDECGTCGQPRAAHPLNGFDCTQLVAGEMYRYEYLQETREGWAVMEATARHGLANTGEDTGATVSLLPLAGVLSISRVLQVQPSNARHPKLPTRTRQASPEERALFGLTTPYERAVAEGASPAEDRAQREVRRFRAMLVRYIEDTVDSEYALDYAMSVHELLEYLRKPVQP